MKALIYLVTALFYTSLISTSFAFDVDGDGKEGLAESIHALQVASGIIPTPPATGDASPQDVLIDHTFSTSRDIGLSGTMPNWGALTIPPGPVSGLIPEGYHNGSGVVEGDPDLQQANIKKGTAIFGVIGTLSEVECIDVHSGCLQDGSGCRWDREMAAQAEWSVTWDSIYDGCLSDRLMNECIRYGMLTGWDGACNSVGDEMQYGG